MPTLLLAAAVIEIMGGALVRAVLVISGHRETAEFAVSSGAWPGMVFDYYGFPEHLYRIKYDAPGSPELAMRVRAMLQAGGFACESDPERGFDHGTFSLMKPLYPNGEMPIVQLSVKQDLDPQAHLSVGRLVAPLRDEGVVIIGSGLSFHNLGDLGELKPCGPANMTSSRICVPIPFPTRPPTSTAHASPLMAAAGCRAPGCSPLCRA